MDPCLIRPAQAWMLCLSLLVSSSNAAAQPAALPSIRELATLAQGAKAEFRPVTQTDIEQARAQLIAAVNRLEDRLRPEGPNGQDWRTYLRLDDLAAQLQAGRPAESATLDEVYRRYTAGHEGLNLVWFLEVRDALRRYRDRLANLNNPNFKAAYDQLLDSLGGHLQAYAANPTTEEALILGEAVNELEQAEQAPRLVQAIQQHFGQPNLFLEASADMVAAGLGGPVDETSPVTDCILGTSIHGTGRTTGQLGVQFYPHPDLAVIDTILRGATHARTIGYNGPVQIRSVSTACLAGRKRVWVGAQGLCAWPAASRVNTSSTILDINAKRAIIERAAWRRSSRLKSTADAIASQHAVARLNRRMDSQAASQIAQANQNYHGKFRRPLVERDLFPQLLRFSTTSDNLQTVALRADAGQLAAPTAPPPITQPADLTARVHESLFNNLAISALTGMTVREKTFADAVVSVLGKLPEALKGDEDQEPWGIEFARREPITVSFANNGFTVTLRGRRYYKGEDRYPGMNVSATYKIAQTSEGFKALRQGELQIYPPGFVPGGDRKLSSREVVIRKLLQRRFGQIFTEEIAFEGFAPPGDWAKAGKMAPVQVASSDGWLSLAWRRAPAAPVAAKVPTTTNMANR